MFTLDNINEERIKFQNYTGYSIPIIQDVLYEESNSFYGEIKREDFLNGKCIIHLSNSLNKFPLEYQKSIIWHEFVHLYDKTIINLEGNSFYYALDTYSEAHASSIQLRYLLHINLKVNIGAERRTLIGENGKTTLDAIAIDYINKCIAMSRIIDINPTPKYFNDLINYFCYFCGYLLLLTKDNANKVIIEATKKFSKNHISIFRELYQAIIDYDYGKCAAIYDGLYTYYKGIILNK